eukprot:scaffold7078_cov148-Skeletonema_marinoi.AAC.6
MKVASLLVLRYALNLHRSASLNSSSRIVAHRLDRKTGSRILVRERGTKLPTHPLLALRLRLRVLPFVYTPSAAATLALLRRPTLMPQLLHEFDKLEQAITFP